MNDISLYTDSMKRAFRSIEAPKNFSLTVSEHSEGGTLLFLELIVSEKDIMSLGVDDQRRAIMYMMKVRDALMQEGAIVQISRGA
jgi:hypothetical protein